ncbi:MAG: helix-turn-helix domain-containing protein [Bacteroidota bacterium]
MTLTFSQIFVLLALLQGFAVCSLLLFSRYFRVKANYYLALCFGVVVCLGLFFWLNEYTPPNPYFILLNDIMWEYLFPVFFLLYVVHAIKHPLKNDIRLRLLFLPFIITLIINVILDLDDEFHVYSIITPENEHLQQLYYQWEDIGTLVFAISVFAFAFKLILGTRNTPIFKWMFQVWAMCMAMVVIWLITWLLSMFMDVELVNYVWGSLNILFFWVSIKGISQFKLAEDQFEIRLKKKVVEPMIEKAISTTGKDCDNPYFQQLEKMMREEKLYRDSTIGRDVIAESLGISGGYLSQVISSCQEQNFSDYINAYRVEEVIRLLNHPDFSSYSFLAIGLEAGFNSKSTFFSVFKKMTGMTPSEYKKTSQIPQLTN